MLNCRMPLVMTTKTITASEVAAMFRDAFKKEPWPVETECARLAGFLNNVRKLQISATDADVQLRKRRETISKIKRLLTSQTATLRALHSERHVSNATAKPGGSGLPDDMLRSLEQLQFTLTRAEPALLFPITRPLGARTQTVWHEQAFAVTLLSKHALKKRGHVSIDRNGPLVRFVSAALKRATGRYVSPSTIATALRQTPIAGNSAPP